MTEEKQDSQTFADLGLSQPLLDALADVGYEIPSPIQAKSIPFLLDGRDILGQAQTGTGKTAAFALPLLQSLKLDSKNPELLVLTPTRELAIQVCEAFKKYSRYIKGLQVLPVYGGQGYDHQLKSLKRGVNIVVGTPGRVMDHMRRGTLKLDSLKHLVLDEADEMLRMGFIDDVEWVLEHTPDDRQIALFSATMPRQIAKVAKNYLSNPAHVKIETKVATAETIRQRYWLVKELHKLDAMTRIFEVEKFDAAIVFVRTKTTTVELAEKLAARGYRTAALNGDLSQQLRERTIEKLKRGEIDVLLATDVAARGLDVQRISLVMNYDIPYDTEAYVHRIGRTGRAGRTGDAILFVSNRERRMLRAIEKATGSDIEQMNIPSVSQVNEKRVERFKEELVGLGQSEKIGPYRELVESILAEEDITPIDLAAACALLAQGNKNLFLKESTHKRKEKPSRKKDESRNKDSYSERKKPSREFSKEASRDDRGDRDDKPRKPRRTKPDADMQMDVYRLDVGSDDGVEPRHIVGAIANEADIESQYIQNVTIEEAFSTLKLPEGMPKSLLRKLKKVWVCQKQLNIARFDGEVSAEKKIKKRQPSRKPRKKG